MLVNRDMFLEVDGHMLSLLHMAVCRKRLHEYIKCIRGTVAHFGKTNVARNSKKKLKMQYEDEDNKFQ